MDADFKDKKVAIILGFYNGNDFIEAQIKSIIDQDFKNIDIFIFDDNSKIKLKFKNLKITKNYESKIKINHRKNNVGSPIIALKDFNLLSSASTNSSILTRVKVGTPVKILKIW